jgi:pyruvate/2-oxoglutarate dehydrogenase complex dihydrolipoamide acyltransferase (E2) component
VQPVCPHSRAQKINEFGRKARDGTLSIDEMAGGTFTIR